MGEQGYEIKLIARLVDEASGPLQALQDRVNGVKGSAGNAAATAATAATENIVPIVAPAGQAPVEELRETMEASGVLAAMHKDAMGPHLDEHGYSLPGEASRMMNHQMRNAPGWKPLDEDESPAAPFVAAIPAAEKAGEEAGSAFGDGVKTSFGGDEDTAALWPNSPILVRAGETGEEAGTIFAAGLAQSAPKAAEAGAETGAAFAEAENAAQAEFRAARDTLGFLPTTASIEAAKAEIIGAYETIKNSALATDDEIARAHAAMQEKIAAIDEASFGKSRSVIRRGLAAFRKNWLQVGTAVFAAAMAAREAWHLMNIGAQAEQSEAAFDSVAAHYHVDAGAIVDSLKRVSDGTIVTSTLMADAAQELQHGLNAGQIVSLMKIARSQARQTGETVQQTYSEIEKAVNTGMTWSLKHLGLIIDQTQAYRQYAASIGVAVGDLTEEERTQATVNALIADGNRQMAMQGPLVESNFEKMQKGRAKRTEGFQDLGKGLLMGLNGVADAGKWAAKEVDEASARWQQHYVDLYHPEDAKKLLAVQAEIAAETAKEAPLQQAAAAASAKQAAAQEAIVKSAAEMSAKLKPFYGELTSLEKEATSELSKYGEKLKSIEDEIGQSRETTYELVLGIEEKHMTPAQRYYAETQDLERRHTMAMGEHGKQKIRDLQELQHEWAQLSGGVKDGKHTIVSAAAAEGTAINQVQQLGAEIEAAEERRKTAIQGEISLWTQVKTQAVAMLDAIKTKIEDLPVSKKMTLDVSEALAKIQEVADALGKLNGKSGGKGVAVGDMRNIANQVFRENFPDGHDSANGRWPFGDY